MYSLVVKLCTKHNHFKWISVCILLIPLLVCSFIQLFNFRCNLIYIPEFLFCLYIIFILFFNDESKNSRTFTILSVEIWTCVDNTIFSFYFACLIHSIMFYKRGSVRKLWFVYVCIFALSHPLIIMVRLHMRIKFVSALITIWMHSCKVLLKSLSFSCLFDFRFISLLEVVRFLFTFYDIPFI